MRAKSSVSMLGRWNILYMFVLSQFIFFANHPGERSSCANLAFISSPMCIIKKWYELFAFSYSKPRYRQVTLPRISTNSPHHKV